MPKATLSFNLDDPSEAKAHRRAVHSTDAYLALWTIANEIFRPYRKHGYSDEVLNEYLNNENKVVSLAVYGSIHKLEKMFYEILNEHDINLDRDLS